MSGRTTTNSRFRRSQHKGDSDEEEDIPPPSLSQHIPSPRIVATEERPDPAEIVRTFATYTAPDFSLVFIAFFIALTYFHESHFAYTGVVVGLWIALQLVSYVIKEDFRNDLFWSIFGLIGNLIFYLFIGHCWSLAKLYLDGWQGLKHNAFSLCPELTQRKKAT